MSDNRKRCKLLSKQCSKTSFSIVTVNGITTSWLMMLPYTTNETSSSKLPIEAVADNNSFRCRVCSIVCHRYASRRIRSRAQAVSNSQRRARSTFLARRRKQEQKMHDKSACFKRLSRTAGLTPQLKSRPSKLATVSSTRTTSTHISSPRITRITTLRTIWSLSKTTIPRGWWLARTREIWAWMFMGENTNSISWHYLHLMVDYDYQISTFDLA